MTAKLSKELQEALHNSTGDDVELVDPTTNRVYVLIDYDLHARAMVALRQQQDWEAIQEGVAQADAGQTVPLAEADRRIRDSLGFADR